jgi:WD40 repeat protein
MNRLLVLVAFALSLAGVVPGAARAEAPDRKPPNVVIILIDDLGWRDVGCFGSTFYETPNIDRLARRGMRFTAGYAACCVCSPTRASLLTGKYPARLHLTDYIPGSTPRGARLRIPAWTQHLALDEVSLARALKPAGYVSACIGKWHLDEVAGPVAAEERYSPERHGFDVNVAGSSLGQPPDYFFPYRRKLADGREYQLTHLPGGREGEYLTDRLTDEAEKFLDRNRDRPFFLYLAHYAVHTSMGARLQAKPRTIARYQARPRPDAGQKDPVYAAMVESMDESVGRLVRKLDELKIADRTLILFTSDNGGLDTATSNAPLRGAKATPYEGGVRVPWTVCWPGVVPAGSVCTVPVASIDWYPTVLEAAGVAPGPKQVVDGESLLPLLRQRGSLRRQALYWHYPHYSDGTTPYGAVRRGNDKLIEFYEDGRLELYDLQADPGEKHDLAGAQPARAQQLRQLLSDWRKQVGAQMPAPDRKDSPRAVLGGQPAPRVTSVAFSPDGKTVASGTGRTIQLWDVATAEKTTTLKGHGYEVLSVAYSPDGKTLASGSDDETIKLWDTASGKNTATLQGQFAAFLCVRFSPDGKTLASGSNDQTIALWDLATRRKTATLRGQADPVWSLAYSPNGKMLASSGSEDRTINLWDVATGKPAAVLRGHRAPVWSVAFHPNGKVLASAGGEDRTVKLWDVATGKNTATFEGHTSWVLSVAFSPDGKTLASGSSDKTIKLWDVATGTNTATLTGHAYAIRSLAFSPDGKTLASGSNDGTVRLWDVPPAGRERK